MNTTDPMDAAIKGQRTTLAGKPFPEQNADRFTNNMFSDGGGLGSTDAGAAGADLFPLGSTDDSLVRVPIHDADLEPVEAEAEPESANNDSFSREIQVKKGRFGDLFKGIRGRTTSNRQKKREGGSQMMLMSRGDFQKYWAKDKHGKFLRTVVEPPDGRREWVRKQLERNEEWIRSDPSLANVGTTPKVTKKNESYSMATALGQDYPGFGV